MPGSFGAARARYRNRTTTIGIDTGLGRERKGCLQELCKNEKVLYRGRPAPKRTDAGAEQRHNEAIPDRVVTERH